MANLKADLIGEINRKLRYSQIELQRLAQSPDMVYSEKIELMQEELERIAILEGELNLTQRFFPEPQQQVAPAPNAEETDDAQNIVASQEEPVAQPVAGQSHGE